MPTEVSDYIGPITETTTTTHDRDPVDAANEFVKMALAAAKAKTQLICSKPLKAQFAWDPAKQGHLGALLPITDWVDWEFGGNLEIDLAPHQPVNDPNVIWDVYFLQLRKLQRFHILGLLIDYQGAEQYTTHVVNPDGFYCNGIDVRQSVGPDGLDITQKNCRGLVGVDTMHGPNGVPTSESFYWCSFGNAGGDKNVRLVCVHDDGSTPSTGPVWQGYDPSSLPWEALVVGYGLRHFFGTYGGGHGTLLDGSYSLNCPTGVNIEAGPKGTPSIQIGKPGGSGVKIVGSKYGVLWNGNGARNGSLAAYGVDTEGCDYGIAMAGQSGVHAEFHDSILGCKIAAINLMGDKDGSKAKSLHLQNVRYSKTAKACVGGTLLAANGLPQPV